MKRPETSLDAFHEGRQKLRVGILVLDNFTLNAFSGFIDALRLAADTGGRSRQIECGWVIMGHGPVRASCGLSITPDAEPMDPGRFDYIAVAGGNDYPQRAQPAWLTRYLQQADAAGVRLVGLCTGTFNIARAGLMEGRTACVHWNVHDEFRSQFPNVRALSDRIFFDAGDRITCAGSTGAPDLALHLIGRHCGPERAQQSLRHMVLSNQRDASFPQAQFAEETRSLRDSVVRRAILIMEQTLDAPISLEDLASRLGISPRHLSRRFTESLGQSPSRYYRFLRVRYGAWRLVHSTERVSEVATEAGFSDASHFLREFKQVYGTTPARYRKALDGARRGAPGGGQGGGGSAPAGGPGSGR
ncbi:GlxA family transcriptional regulator [Limimaricola pyoseonensis]|uniref:Transcriptional regulator GlxA family, contains an amidase domain and an AraC-type DNA-binding HTH domain n=1 Tax=Limimaricola pyoseonensis TaxID=521013 RepID=A0A1G7EXM4_9RHOB|nr:GlxA family transcriptional regulator [Limimaricola pyoseonensis]SDE68453.1 Transcriptional regulator GlxA family, contains an amidase domain and an AraC-type DNA-binding HTH domain [Limimaricola pyoseonensis]